MCLSTAATARPAEVAAAAPDAPRWFQVYVFGDRSQTEELIAEAIEHRIQRARADRRRALSSVARARPSHRLQGRPSISPSPATSSPRVRCGSQLARHEWLSGYGLPLVVKGLLTAEDARLAVEHGAAAVVVSNHGGRQLDGVVRDPRRARGSRRRRRRACARSSTAAFDAAPTFSRRSASEPARSDRTRDGVGSRGGRGGRRGTRSAPAATERSSSGSALLGCASPASCHAARIGLPSSFRRARGRSIRLAA